MAAEKLSIKDCSLLTRDVMLLQSSLAHWMNATLGSGDAGGAPGTRARVTAIGGPRSSLKDGTVLADLWEALTGEHIECDRAPANEMAEKMNLWSVISCLEEGGVTPVVEGQFWDANAIHEGDVVNNLYLVLALADKFKVRLPNDVYFFEDPVDPESGLPRVMPLTRTLRESPRLAPIVYLKVIVDGVDMGQNVVVLGYEGDRDTLGRYDGAESCADILIPDESVSGTHCEIWFDGSNFRVADDESTHGTVVRQPWSREVIDLGDRDHISGKEAVLFRGTELFLGDSHLIVMSIEGTQFYSDYPSIPGLEFGLNLDIINGAQFEGMTTLGVHHPGTVFGSTSNTADLPDAVQAMGLALATVPELPELTQACIYFSNYFGRYVLVNYGDLPCKIMHAATPERGWVDVHSCSFDFIDMNDEIDLSDVLIFRAVIIPPATA